MQLENLSLLNFRFALEMKYFLSNFPCFALCWMLESLQIQTSWNDFQQHPKCSLAVLTSTGQFQVNIPTTKRGWKVLLYVSQQHKILSSHPNSNGNLFRKKKEIFRCRIEFEFIFHQTRVEFHVRPRGIFGIKLFPVWNQKRFCGTIWRKLCRVIWCCFDNAQKIIWSSSMVPRSGSLEDKR